MSPSLLDLLTLATALGAGAIGGVFFAFSSFVMRALARLPPVSAKGGCAWAALARPR